jgi:hypothetical protein
MKSAERRPEGGAGDEARDVPDVFVPQGLTAKEALELAALDAAVFRGASEKTLNRKIQIVAKDGTVRPGVGRDVLRGLAKIQGLEHVVQEGVRPKEVVCQNCGKSVPVKSAIVPRVCTEGCQTRCACGAAISKKAARTAARAGRSVQCRKCTVAKATQALLLATARRTPEERVAQAVKAARARGPAMRAESSRKRSETWAKKMKLIKPATCSGSAPHPGCAEPAQVKGQCRRCYANNRRANSGALSPAEARADTLPRCEPPRC